MKWQALVVFIYALFILVGGLMGFIKASSYMSLVMGTIAGVALLIAAAGIYQSYGWGLVLAFIVTGLLIFFFGYRFSLKLAFFPAGLTGLVSVATFLFLSFFPRK